MRGRLLAALAGGILAAGITAAPPAFAAGGPGGSYAGGSSQDTGTITVGLTISYTTTGLSTFALNTADLDAFNGAGTVTIQTNDPAGYGFYLQGPPNGDFDTTGQGDSYFPDSYVDATVIPGLGGASATGSGTSGVCSNDTDANQAPTQLQVSGAIFEVIGVNEPTGNIQCVAGTPAGDDSFSLEGFELTGGANYAAGTYQGALTYSLWGS